jgi:hypothetical protein
MKLVIYMHNSLILSTDMTNVCPGGAYLLAGIENPIQPDLFLINLYQQRNVPYTKKST